jgi:hypothetical protein
MTKIDLTSKEKAFAYLSSLPEDSEIEIVSPASTTAAEDAVGVIVEEGTLQWANNRRKWNFTKAELLAEMKPYITEVKYEVRQALDGLYYVAEVGSETERIGSYTRPEAEAVLRGEDEGVEIFKGEITGLNRKGMRE